MVRLQLLGEPSYSGNQAIGHSGSCPVGWSLLGAVTFPPVVAADGTSDGASTWAGLDVAVARDASTSGGHDFMAGFDGLVASGAGAAVVLCNESSFTFLHRRDVTSGNELPLVFLQLLGGVFQHHPTLTTTQGCCHRRGQEGEC